LFSLLREEFLMTRREVGELCLIAAAAGSACFIPRLPATIPIGELVLAGSVALLAQGLIRDLVIKYGGASKGAQTAPAQKRGIVCMCMESTVGVAGVAAGICVLLAGIRRPVALPVYFWPVAIAVVGVTGFIIKDYVIDWTRRPWRIRKEKDHSSVVFW
jgi:hypothetical protein